MLLIIDNYDSFTYNLFQALAALGEEVKVVRNDALTTEQVAELDPAAVVLSPGPGIPQEAGICVDLVRSLAPKIPILGVCLGHQAIAVAFGGRVIRAGEVVHGKASKVFHRRQGLFADLSLPFAAGRYHSLIVERESLPESLLIEADDLEGTVMGLRHSQYPCYGVQFHPESILTAEGRKIFRAFLEVATTRRGREGIRC